MTTEAEMVLNVLGADPMSATEIVNVIYSHLDEGSRGTRKGNIYKTLGQLEKHDKVERMMVMDHRSRTTYVWVSKTENGPNMQSVIDVLDHEYASVREITERIYGSPIELLMPRVTRVLSRLERMGRVERYVTHTEHGSYVQAWRLAE